MTPRPSSSTCLWLLLVAACSDVPPDARGADAASGDSGDSERDAGDPERDAGDAHVQLACGDVMREGVAIEPTASCGEATSTGSAPDALVHYASLCERCDSEGFAVLLQVGNRGTAAIAPDTLTIEIFGYDNGFGRSLATLDLDEEIASGLVLDGIEIDLASEWLGDFDTIVVSVAGVPDDCQADNDTIAVMGPFCAGSH